MYATNSALIDCLGPLWLIIHAVRDGTEFCETHGIFVANNFLIESTFNCEKMLCHVNADGRVSALARQGLPAHPSKLAYTGRLHKLQFM